MARDTCADCVYMDFNNRNSMNSNEFYCRKRGHYYDPDDTACRDFVARISVLKPFAEIARYENKSRIKVKTITVT